jgi:DNA-binding NtrC family response regulator
MREPHERILVVDDEENVLILFKRVLGKEGYQVECASSAYEALKKLQDESFDLVLTDLKMDGMDGLDLVKKWKTVNPAMPFIMVTAYGTIQAAMNAGKEGVENFLIKPIDIEELKMAVKKALKKLTA